MQNLMELDYGWANLDNSFIFKVVQILSSETSPINVCRPATAILKKLVEADPGSASGSHMGPSTSKGPPTPPPGSVYRYGFDVVYEQMRKERRLLETVVGRLGSADTTMALYRCVPYPYPLIAQKLEFMPQQHDVDQLVNGPCERPTMGRVHRRTGALECSESSHRACPFCLCSCTGLKCALQRLMSSHTIEDLTSCILDFQANMVRVTFRKKTTLVEPDFEPLHSSALQFIWDKSRLQEEREDAITTIKWRQLGFDTEDIGHEFREVGVLGLDCLVCPHLF